jgi:YHS domain-containing protein
MAVDREQAAGRLNFEQAAFFFCSRGCAAEFATHPERFIS